MDGLIHNKEFQEWAKVLKERIMQAQVKAVLSVNRELILLYWDLGRLIVEKQINSNWGEGIIDGLSRSLRDDFPELKGFSRENLYYMKRFYSAYRELGQFVEQAVPQTQNEIMEQLVPQLPEPDIKHLVSSIPWGHNVLILKKIKAPDEALFYIRETISNNWSRSVLQMQIESNLYLRQGKAVNNFKLTLPEPQSDLAVQMLKDPYNFNFLTLEKNVRELEVESQLTTNITRLLLEMGKGFAYLGRQYPILVSGREYRLDLLFYQVKLKCYILIELKTGDFEPEFIGKLNFYLSALDTQVKAPDEAPSIGILLCKNKENLIVEYSLRDIKKPIGVSTFTFNELPADIKSFMPSIEDFENEMNRTNDAF